MQLFTLFRSQNKGLISTPIFTPNSFYNSLPYFTEKPANPWKNYVLLRAFSLFYTSLKFHCIISSHSCIFRWYNAIIQDIRQNSNLRLIFQARRRKRLRHPCPRHAFCAHSNKQLQLVLLKKSRQHANLFPCYWQNATRCVGSISSFWENDSLPTLTMIRKNRVQCSKIAVPYFLPVESRRMGHLQQFYCTLL